MKDSTKYKSFELRILTPLTPNRPKISPPCLKAKVIPLTAAFGNFELLDGMSLLQRQNENVLCANEVKNDPLG